MMQKKFKERKEAKENFVSGELYEIYEKSIEEIDGAVKTEMTKALFLLAFISILVVVSIPEIMHYSHVIKVILYGLISIDVGLLLIVILGIDSALYPKKTLFHTKFTEKDFQEKYQREFTMRNKKRRYNIVSIVLSMVIFLTVIFLLFFMKFDIIL